MCRNATEDFLARFARKAQTSYRGITHPEKFVHVIGENAQEAQAIQKRYGFVAGFLQYARVKAKPAFFAVYISVIFVCHYRKSLGSMTRSVVPIPMEFHWFAPKLMVTHPAVGTLSIKISPNLLTKSVIASL